MILDSYSNFERETVPVSISRPYIIPVHSNFLFAGSLLLLLQILLVVAPLKNDENENGTTGDVTSTIT